LGILILFGFYSCQNKAHKLNIAASNHSTSNHSAALTLKKELENNTKLKLSITENLHTSKDNLISVLEGNSDLGIIQNTINYEDFGYDEAFINQHIRTILPLYDQVLFIIYNKKHHSDNLKELLTGKRVGFGKKDGGDAWMVQEVFDYLGIPDSIYTPVYTDYANNIVGNNIDISCSVTSYNNPRIVKMLRDNNNQIFSFEQTSNIDHIGSAASGIGLKNTTISEFVIPRYSYGLYPENPILTVCTQAVLICNKSMDEDISHRIIEDILAHKTLLANNNPIYDMINENFNSHKLRFPLHLGVKMFLDRNKPSFLEKYAEVMALIVTILALLFGGISSLRNWQKMKKKDRIDIYYQKVIDTDERILNVKNKSDLEIIENHLFQIRDEAFELLIEEKLIADESFNIFLRLLESSLRRIEDKQQNLHI
jgi:TRAP-type uncharacterized transport system substrate-binding protein